MLIGVSGKIQSGKDTVGKIIQYLTFYPEKDAISFGEIYPHECDESPWKIKKYADALKLIASILTAIPVEDFEKIEVKNSELGSEWSEFSPPLEFLAKGSEYLSTEIKMTVRRLLQKLGTEAIRNNLHSEAWVNALFANYKPYFLGYDIEDGVKYKVTGDLPNWVVTDVRFENEAKAIEDRGGILIRVNRDDYESVSVGEEAIKIPVPTHPSETSLDHYPFHWVIENNGTIEQLVERVRNILTVEEIIK